MKRKDLKWEVDYSDIIRDEHNHEGWKLDAHGLNLLREGWEPFSVTNVSIFLPHTDPPYDTYSERVWFRRRA